MTVKPTSVYVPHVRVESTVGGKPEVVVGYNVRMNDPLSVQLLIDRLYEVIGWHAKDNRWIIE